MTKIVDRCYNYGIKIEKMKYIDCTGKNGTIERFEYKIEFNRLENTWIFRVYSLETKTDEFFEFQVKKIDDRTVKVIVMSHHGDPAYVGKGIAERILEEAYRVLNLKIISSSTSSKHEIFDNEWMTEDAFNFWERMQKKGKAYFDNKNKVFCYSATGIRIPIP